MRERVPEFAKAREAWAGPAQLMDGIDLGKKGLSMDLDTFRTTWRGAGSAQQEGMQIGLINGLKSQVRSFAAGPTADASRAIARKGAVREKLRTVLGNTQADELLRRVDLESLASGNTNQIMGNSATARREAAGAALGDEPIENTPTSVRGIIGRVLGRLDQVAQERTRAAIARLGLVTDPDEAANLADRLLNALPAHRAGLFPAPWSAARPAASRLR